MVAARVQMHGNHGLPAVDVSTEGAQLEAIAFGPPGALSHRVFLVGQGGKQPLSSWKDIPLFGPDGLLRCVCKTPAGSWVRYEVAEDEPFHPLRLVRKGSVLRDGKGRSGRGSTRGGPARAGGPEGEVEKSKIQEAGSVKDEALPMAADGRKPPGTAGWEMVRALLQRSLRPVHFRDNAPWNVCMLPQAWGGAAKPGSINERLPCGEVEVVEFGLGKLRKLGEVYLVKALATLGLEKEGGMAWKIIAIAADDPMASLLEDLGDINMQLPGLLELIRQWVETCEGGRKGARRSLLLVGSGPSNLSRTQDKVQQLHEAWKRCSIRQVASPQPPSKDSGAPLATAVLERIWKLYTAKDLHTFWGPIPASCPPAESAVFFDLAWFEPQPRLPHVPSSEYLSSGLATPIGSVDSESDGSRMHMKSPEMTLTPRSEPGPSRQHSYNLIPSMVSVPSMSSIASMASSHAGSSDSQGPAKPPVAMTVGASRGKKGLSSLFSSSHKSGPEAHETSKGRPKLSADMFGLSTKSHSKAAAPPVTSQSESKFHEAKLTRSNTVKGGSSLGLLALRRMAEAPTSLDA